MKTEELLSRLNKLGSLPELEEAANLATPVAAGKQSPMNRSGECLSCLRNRSVRLPRRGSGKGGDAS
jgi:hypothetical protein